MDHPASSPAAWSPDGRALAYARAGRLRIFTLGRGEREIAPAAAVASVSWSTPLNLLAVVDRGAVWTLRSDGSERRQLALPAPAVAAVWAPGSDRLGVVLRQTLSGRARYELWLANRDGGFRRMVVRAPERTSIRDLHWFPDNLYLLYGLGDAGAPEMTEVWRVRVSYPDRRTIPVPPGSIAVRLAPSGGSVAFVEGERARGRPGGVIVSRLDGSGSRSITQRGGRYRGLTWSPQSDKLAYAEVVDEGHAVLWIADADGSGTLRLYSYALEYPDPAIDLTTAWAPDGQALVFGTHTGPFIGPVWLATLTRR